MQELPQCQHEGEQNKKKFILLSKTNSTSSVILKGYVDIDNTCSFYLKENLELPIVQHIDLRNSSQTTYQHGSPDYTDQYEEQTYSITEFGHLSLLVSWFMCSSVQNSITFDKVQACIYVFQLEKVPKHQSHEENPQQSKQHQ